METQFNNEAGSYMRRKLLSTHLVHETIGSAVVSYFGEVGGSPPADLQGQFQLKPLAAFSCSRGMSDAQAKLEWLRSQVAPTVQRLIRCGHFDSVVKVLGISDHMDQQLTTEEDENAF
jgi:hypothetical protein